VNQPLFLSRARLRTGRGEQLSAIAPVLLAGSKGDTVGNAHRILWMLFRDRDEKEPRDFLWREEALGRYLILSKRAPGDEHGLFDLQTKEYAPKLASGDRLAFALRANPVVTRKSTNARKKGKADGKGRLRGERCDIVMDALHGLPKRLREDPRGESKRAKARDHLTQAAARSWIEKQGERCGFRLLPPRLDEDGEPFPIATNYEVIEIPRGKTNAATGEWKPEPKTRFAQFGVLDFEGLIEVTDPAAFTKQLAEGFGKAKAFGCGLMLIKRAA
jgi:CRISPR system Cascade subunit CasE